MESIYFLINNGKYKNIYPAGSLSCLRGNSKCFPISDLCMQHLDKHGQTTHCRNGYHLGNCDKCPCTNTFKYLMPCSRECDGRTNCPYREEVIICMCKMAIWCPTRMKWELDSLSLISSANLMKVSHK